MRNLVSALAFLISLNLVAGAGAERVNVKMFAPDPWLNELAQAFNQQSADIAVTIVTPQQGESATAALYAGLAQGDYDLVIIPSASQVEELAKQGMLVPLLSYLDRNLSTVEISTIVDVGARGDAFPLIKAFDAVYARESLLDAAGFDRSVSSWTWDDMVDWSVRLTRPEDNQYGISLKDDFWTIPFVQIDGGDFSLGSYEGLRLAMKIARDVRTTFQSHPPKRADEQFYQSINHFYIDRLSAMFIDGFPSNIAFFLAPGAAALSDLDIMLLPMPGPHVEGNVGRGEHRYFLAVPAHSERLSEALAFVQWALTDEGAASALIAGSFPPRIPAIAPSPVSMELERVYGPGIRGYLTMRLRSIHPATPGLSEISQAITARLAEFSSQAELSLEEAFQSLVEEIQPLLLSAN